MSNRINLQIDFVDESRLFVGSQTDRIDDKLDFVVCSKSFGCLSFVFAPSRKSKFDVLQTRAKKTLNKNKMQTSCAANFEANQIRNCIFGAKALEATHFAQTFRCPDKAMKCNNSEAMRLRVHKRKTKQKMCVARARFFFMSHLKRRHATRFEHQNDRALGRNAS